MKLFINKVKKHFSIHELNYVFVSLFLISVACFIHFFQNNQHLLYGDALSRMNISRKIIDNLTPGLAQLGNVWLPLPQLFMLLFIWNNYLWHSGIAGAIISMVSFICGGLYLYKSARILSNSFLASLFSLSIYALNINLLYLQTTAMSESIFLCSVIIAIYYFIVWIRAENKILNLIFAATAISASTLIRYEALSLLLPSIPMVFFYSWYKSKRYQKAEGNTLLYGLLACLGFAMWTLYLAVIFGDPLFWKNYYTGTHVVGDAKTQLHIFTFHLNFFQAFWKYFTAVVWMNGLIPTVLAIIALPILAFQSIKRKTFYFLPVLLSFSMFVFMILTLQRNTPIDQPNLSVTSIISYKTSNFPEFNIRYGLLMLPAIALLCSYLFNIKYIIIKIALIGLLFIQFYSYYKPNYSVIYQIPISISNNNTQGTPKEKAMTKWLKDNYDNGLIMISALKHDPQMLQLGHDYKTYIHEGAGRYWIESKKDPQRYATWIVFDSYNKDDQVTKFLRNSNALKLYYNLVYENEGMKIFKIKTKPDIEIK
jgi:hypothetical protein